MMQNTIIYDLPHDKYNADPCEVPSLSRSCAHTLVSKCAAHARLCHPRLGGERKGSTRSMDDGTVIHDLLLGTGGNTFEVVKAKNKDGGVVSDFRTKAAKEEKERIETAGKVAVLQHKLDRWESVAGKLRMKLAKLGYDLSAGAGVCEPTLLWSRGEVQCRSRPDFMSHDRMLLLDIKTTENAHPDACTKHAFAFGYDMQWASCVEAIEKLSPELGGRVRMVFLFCELLPPYCVTPWEPAGTMREVGNLRWGTATAEWLHCLKNDSWQDYSNGQIVRGEARSWMIEQAMGEEI